MWVLILLFVVIAVLCYSALTSAYGYWNKRGVPHPPVSKLFGNMGESLIFRKSVGQIYVEIYRNYPSLRYVGFYKFRQPGIIVKDPELIKEVLVKSFYSFHDNDLTINEDINPLIAKTPLFMKGEKWKATRNLLTPSFTGKQVKSMMPLMEQIGRRLVNYLKETDCSCVDAKELTAKYTTDVVASCAFGLEANCFQDTNSEFKKNCQKLLSQSFLTGVKLLFQLGIPSLAQFFKLKLIADDVADYFSTIISQTIEYRTKHSVVRSDFLNMMLGYQRKYGEDVFTNEDITAHSVGTILDGFETTSIVLSFALYELAANPDVQDKLRNEVDTILKKYDGVFTYEAMQDMVYLEKFVCENLRKHPPTMFTIKVCTKPFTLPSPTENGAEVNIDAGTSVVIPIYSLHYDPKYYPDPERFDPERFSEENKEAREKFTYMPFGDGPRVCLGQRFAVAQIKVAIASVVSNFEIRVNSKTITPIEIDPMYFFLAAKGGLWLDFYKRKMK